MSILRKKGGLGIPDVYFYYLAYNGVYPISWAYRKEEPAMGGWRWLEQKFVAAKCKNVALTSLWYHIKPDKSIKHPMIIFSCRIAKEILNN